MRGRIQVRGELGDLVAEAIGVDGGAHGRIVPCGFAASWRCVCGANDAASSGDASCAACELRDDWFLRVEPVGVRVLDGKQAATENMSRDR
jgi:hypothetical protein